LTQKLRQPLELMPGWSANPLDGSLPRVRQRLELSTAAVPRWHNCSLTPMMSLSMWWLAEVTGRWLQNRCWSCSWV
jgi:hypothetical protein